MGLLAASPPRQTAAQQQAALAAIHSIAVIPPFFGVPASALPRGKSPAQTTALQAAYLHTLKKLQEVAVVRLSQRIASRLSLKIAPGKTVNQILQSEHLTARELFDQHGAITGGRYPKLNLKACGHLCERLHVDAVLVTDLDGPQRIGGHYVFVPLQGSGYEPSHVVSSGEFNVVNQNGELVLTSSETVQHPATRIGAQQFILADWLEAQNLLIENFMDYWNLKLN